ncbi:hypothetical protein IWW36_000612 [Coemansia brasiliensis]|uniref:Uncharacterized protein n=1 Tax=Coemansia brasiliensis TaxID=2650707 RepID=A0A9W8IJB5_9FUNG|nr:hypothetical protein IWW36_000612 [Coemansia brasiliensis]
MEIDLLGDDDQNSCNLTSAIQPQPKFPDLSQRLSNLNLATVSNKHTESSEDDDEFGEFLQSSAASGADLLAKPNSNNTTSQPAPPLRPVLNTNKPESSKARRNTIATPLPLSSSSHCIADQILDWISDPKLPANPHAAAPETDNAIDRAWDSAAGLLGGTDIRPHIGEIATRLCSAIPRASPPTKQASDSPPAIVLLSAESIAELSETLLAAQSSSAIGFGQQISDIVWPQHKPAPLHSLRSTTISNDDLVNAYLRLVDNNSL